MKAAPWRKISDDALSQRREERNHALHLQRIRDTKPLVDCSIPSTSRLTITRTAKQKQLNYYKLQEIHHENERLHQKLDAMFRKGAKEKNTTTAKFQQQPLMKGEALFCKSSLNEYARRKELQKIKNENKIINTRIRGQNCIKSNYSRKDLAQKEKQREKYLQNLRKGNRRKISKTTMKLCPEQYQAQEDVPQSLINNVTLVDNLDLVTIKPNLERCARLRTAKQVKEDVIGCGLFDDIILREAALSSVISSSTLKKTKKKSKPRQFIRRHVGSKNESI